VKKPLLAVDNADLLREIKMKSKLSRGKQTTAQVEKALMNQFSKKMAQMRTAS
jgi:hypothetical protein